MTGRASLEGHRPKVLSDGPYRYLARCECGWGDSTHYPTHMAASSALRQHREQVAS